MESNDKQQKLDMRYLKMARVWAENSYCVRRQVGALVVKDKMIIAEYVFEFNPETELYRAVSFEKWAGKQDLPLYL